MSEIGEIYTADKNFTLPPAVTAWTNSTSDQDQSGRGASIPDICKFGKLPHYLGLN